MRHLILLAGLLTALIWTPLSRSVAAQEGLQATQLRCETQSNPLGIDDPQPQLSWECTATRRGSRQTAYRILAASTSQDLARDVGNLWDSGRVESAASSNIEYAGKRLSSRDQVWWKVRVWDAAGVPGTWSEPATWEMGLLRDDDWSAQWINCAPSPSAVKIEKAVYQTPDGKIQVDVTERVSAALEAGKSFAVRNETLGGDPARNQLKKLMIAYVREGKAEEITVREGETVKLTPSRLPLLRRDFAVQGHVVKARLYMTALGIYETSLNGQPLDNIRFPPGWTDYRRRVQYQTFDVTSLLNEGQNVFAAEVAPGWYSGRAGLFHIREFYGTTPELLAQLEIEYEDGRRELIVTDQTWKRIDGPTLTADMLDGETFDARLRVEGWNLPGADLSEWTPVATRTALPTVRAQVDPPVRVLLTLPTQKVTDAGGAAIFDLGQNMVGVARIRVSEPAGTRIRIRYGEMLNPDGTLYTANLREAACTDVYICHGGGVEEWEPKFTFHGFRYVELTGLTNAPSAEMVSGIVIATDTPRIGTFECSDDRVNQLYSNILWGQRGNHLSVPTDCPQRDERMGWMADAQVFLPTAAYNADIRRFMRKWMIDVRDAQREDGAHSDVAPVTRGLNYGTPAWADAGVIVPWTMYETSGDTRVLRENIESMKRWVDWCQEHSTGLLRDRDRGNDYGDWLSIGDDTPKDVIGTAYFARSAQIVAESLKVLNRPAEEARYRQLAEQVKEAFAAAYIDSQGRIKGDTQCVYVMALRFSLVDGERKLQAINRLAEKIEQNSWRLSTGFVGVGMLLPVLTENGRADIAARLLVQEEFPSWLFSVKHGATTIWERWDGWTPKTGPHPDIGMNSFNHYSLGSCGEWLYSGVAGIRQQNGHAGFERIEIAPQIKACVQHAGLTHAKATYQSVRGEIASEWSVDSGKLKMRVVVPVGSIARVRVPAEKTGVVLESGRDIERDRPEGVVRATRDGDAMVVDAGSGTYEFETAWKVDWAWNPVIPGWYADPEIDEFDGTYWMYPTYSAAYEDQTFLDAFSSKDLKTWTKHPRVLDTSGVTWAKKAIWAPSILRKNNRYFLFFGANDIQKDSGVDGEYGGIGVAVSDSPAGPFRDLLGKPLIDRFHNGAQPIDQFAFTDRDGQVYLFYGGWRHCNVAKLRDDLTGVIPFEDGTVFREITPEGYVEGPFMFERRGRYYLMWSEGGWTGPNYSVAYAIAESPLGPFHRVGTILKQDPTIATGAGHHSVVKLVDSDEYYIAYHRRPLGDKGRDHREVCIDRLFITEQGLIAPVQMTPRREMPR